MGQFHGNMNRFIVKAWVSEKGDLKLKEEWRLYFLRVVVH